MVFLNIIIDYHNNWKWYSKPSFHFLMNFCQVNKFYFKITFLKNSSIPLSVPIVLKKQQKF